MGTRNLTIVQLDGKYKVAQYGQWDGYPEGQGATILRFLSIWDRSVFESKIRKAKFITKYGLSKIQRQIDKESLQNSWKERWPHLSRDSGARILYIIHSSPNGIELRNDIDFAGDSLFCEYAYLIDLDNNALEVYMGGNKSPLLESDRFTEIALPDDNNGYFQIKLAAKYGLDQLPSVEQMAADIYKEDEAE